MLDRLANGKNALDVEIEHWQHLVSELEQGHSVIDDDEFALCAKYYNDIDLCERCPYVKHHGRMCTSFNSSYDNHLHDGQNSLYWAKAYLAELEAIKKG